MSLSNEEIRRSMESFERRHRKKKKNMEKAFKRQKKIDKIFGYLKILFFLLFVIAVFLFIKSGSDVEEVYIKDCVAYEKLYQKAYYSKYDIWEDEYDNWEEVVSDVYSVKTVNGLLVYSNNDTTYKNNYNYYSSKMPVISYLEKEDGFQDYKKEKETTIYFNFEDGRDYRTTEKDSYDKCMKYYMTEEPLKVNTFYGNVNSFYFN